jgi:hypothetical protein
MTSIPVACRCTQCTLGGAEHKMVLQRTRKKHEEQDSKTRLRPTPPVVPAPNLADASAPLPREETDIELLALFVSELRLASEEEERRREAERKRAAAEIKRKEEESGGKTIHALILQCSC